jgi:AraC-like DNA-binding protein
VHVYHCHAGLLEGIVPLYDRHSIYLGSIVFGQLRDSEREYPEEDMPLLSRSRRSTRKEMYDIGALLKYSSEYIIENELVQYRSKPWAERLEDYIEAHKAERLTLSHLAAEIGRSTSFLSHNFPLEFGMPLKEYVRQKRMKRAKELLQSGRSVRETAFELGFYDEFHFSKEFKRNFGVPPSSLLRNAAVKEAT